MIKNTKERSIKNDIREAKKDSFWANIALLLLYPYSFLTGLTMMQGVHIIYPAFVISIIFLICIGKSCKNRTLFKRFVLLLFWCLSFYLMNMLFIGNSDIKQIVYGVFIMPCLAVLLFFYKIRYWVSLVLFYSIALFFCAYILQNGPFVNNETEILTNSRNYVSFFVLLYSLPYFIHCYDINKVPSLIVPIICVLISIFSIGRAGIIGSLILLTGILYLKMIQNNKLRTVYRMAFFLILFTTITIGVNDDLIDIYFSRFAENGMDSYGRIDAWLEYIKSLTNPANFLFGTRIKSLYYTTWYLEGSLHNSYLTLHARLGMIGLLSIFFMIKGLWQLIKQRCYPLIPIIAALLIKGITDADTGGTYSGGDIYVFYLALVYLYSYDRRINERKSFRVLPTSIPSYSRE